MEKLFDFTTGLSPKDELVNGITNLCKEYQKRIYQLEYEIEHYPYRNPKRVSPTDSKWLQVKHSEIFRYTNVIIDLQNLIK
jgi:hypothetical protein